MVRYDESTAAKGEKYVRDQRGRGGRRAATAAGGGGIVAIILAVLFAVISGGDPGSVLVETATTIPQIDGPVAVDPNDPAAVDPDAQTIEYMEFLMFDVQDTWDQIFDEAGLVYEPTTLTIFDGAVESGCGRATSQVGPFYCPAPNDRGVYMDLDFYEELARRFGAPGDFAQAYVIAHEIGHHVQAVLGISDQVRQAQAQNPNIQNELSVRQELQADCFAGVWGWSASQRTTLDGLPILEPGDIEEGLRAAASVGDDTIQAQAGMTINPDTWTHGSSAERVEWFQRGLETGDPEQCDTFASDVTVTT
ncbi:MAG: neutral zinc metallopeptidase [Actinomycetota bacterium]